MMIYENVFQVIVEGGFKSIEVNVSNLKVGYKILEDASYLIAIFNVQSSDLLEEQYSNIKRQLCERFHSHYEKEVRLLSIICTDNINKAKHIFGLYPEVWILDNVNYRLLIYENQLEDFLSIRQKLYKALDSMKAEYNDHNDRYHQNMNYNENDRCHQNTSYNENDRYHQSMNENNRYNQDDRYRYENRYNEEESENGVLKYWGIYIILILMNVLVHFIMNLDKVVSTSLINDLVLYWRACFNEQEYYRLFTYMFLHSNIDHLANNMFLLFVLGRNVEMVLGKLKFTILYILSGILAGLGSISYNMYQNNYVVSLGASGAIFGIVGGMAYLVISNRNNIRNISKRQIILFIIFSLYGGFTSNRIDNAAHITGLIAGIFLTAIIDKIGKKPRKGI